MEPLGSPQGAHDAAPHLFGVPHRVEHAACCCCRCEGGGGVSLRAGAQTVEGGLHSTSCRPLLFLSDTNRESAEEPRRRQALT